MGTFQLIIKQMRQRALGTWLTLLSVLLGVALAIAILLLRDAGQALFGQTEFGYDVIVGIGKGSATSLVMNTVYHIDRSPGNIPYYIYEQLNNPNREPRGSKNFDFRRHVKIAVPTAVGDVFKGRPIIGTMPKMFVSLEPLRQRVEELMQQQSSLMSETHDRHTALSPRQDALVSAVDPIRQLIHQADREVVPLLDVSPPEGTQAKGKYGDPIYPRCDQVITEMHTASRALESADWTAAIAHQGTAYRALDDILKSVSANAGPLEYRPDQPLEVGEGRVFHAWKFEAVIGSEVARNAGLGIGSQFQATHGNAPPGVAPETHPEKWTVVGVLKPTHTASDRCLYISLISFYSIAEHAAGLDAQNQARLGQNMQPPAAEEAQYHMAFGDELLPDLPRTKDFVSLDLPPDKWELSSVLVRSRGGVAGEELIYFVANGGMRDVQAVNPARVMQVFFDTFLKSSADILLLISLLVSIVAAVGILVSIYNSVAARTREIAILRALGATRGRVLTLICAEAGIIGLGGAILGMIVGHAVGAAASAYLNKTVGQGFDWWRMRGDEWIYLGIVVGIALLAGLVPALKAYRTPVATNLVAG